MGRVKPKAWNQFRESENPQTSSFLHRLPPELRLEVYNYTFCPQGKGGTLEIHVPRRYHCCYGGDCQHPCARSRFHVDPRHGLVGGGLLSTCQSVYNEAREIPYFANKFSFRFSSHLRNFLVKFKNAKELIQSVSVETPEGTPNKDHSVLLPVIRHGSEVLFQNVLANATDDEINARFHGGFGSSRLSHRSPLCEAMLCGAQWKFWALLDRGAKPRQSDIVEAVERDLNETVLWALVDGCADRKLFFEYSRGPFGIALSRNNSQIALQMTKYIEDVGELEAAVKNAASYSKDDILDHLIDKTEKFVADPTALATKKATFLDAALTSAACKRQTRMVERLVSLGAVRRPEHVFERIHRVSSVSNLLACGWDRLSTNSEGETVLHAAIRAQCYSDAEAKYREIENFILSREDVFIKTKHGISVLAYAMKYYKRSTEMADQGFLGALCTKYQFSQEEIEAAIAETYNDSTYLPSNARLNIKFLRDFENDSQGQDVTGATGDSQS